MKFDLKRAREQMVETQLRRRGITEKRLLDAFRLVPRHEFVPESARSAAYEDTALALAEGQTISQPYMVATMTRAARIQVGDRVLEIGTGSGYQAAILATLGAEVYSVERLPSLAEQAAGTLRRLGYSSVHLRVGDGTLGWPEAAPFNAILVTAGAPQLPQPLVEQLAMGGRLVVPVEAGGIQVLEIVERTEAGLQSRRGEACTFVPLIGRHGWRKG